MTETPKYITLNHTNPLYNTKHILYLPTKNPFVYILENETSTSVGLSDDSSFDVEETAQEILTKLGWVDAKADA